MFTPERALPGLRTSYPKEAVNEVFVNLRMVYGFVRDVRLSGYIRERAVVTHITVIIRFLNPSVVNILNCQNVI